MKKKFSKKQQNSVPNPKDEGSNPAKEWLKSGRTKMSQCQENEVLTRGYTMIEVMIVIAIIGIMSGVMLTLPSTNKSEARLRTAQREVASAIKLTQTYALQGQSQTPVMPCGYGFRFTDNDPATYQIFYNLPGPVNAETCEKMNNLTSSPGVYTYNQFVPGTSLVAENFSLKNNVTLSSPSVADLNNNDTEIYFTIPHANMYDRGGSAYGGQIFTFNFSGTTKTITVNPGGFVEEN